MISKWLEDLAAGFWEEVGEEEPFPRNLENVIQWYKPVAIKKLSGLGIATIRQWLARRNRLVNLDVRDRALNGCLIAQNGTGLLFVEASLPGDDVRMIVAHEFAHYLADYEFPRKRARVRIGPALLPIFDGDRPPTDTEQIEASLAGVKLGPHVHYMDRTPAGTYSEPTSQVEQNANELALELIAPWQSVFADLRTAGSLPMSEGPWVEILQSRFGLPACWARPHAGRLLAAARARRTFSETLGL